jgi:hypothetical protein
MILAVVTLIAVMPYFRQTISEIIDRKTAGEFIFTQSLFALFLQNVVVPVCYFLGVLGCFNRVRIARRALILICWVRILWGVGELVYYAMRIEGYFRLEFDRVASISVLLLLTIVVLMQKPVRQIFPVPQ